MFYIERVPVYLRWHIYDFSCVISKLHLRGDISFSGNSLNLKKNNLNGRFSGSYGLKRDIFKNYAISLVAEFGKYPPQTDGVKMRKLKITKKAIS